MPKNPCRHPLDLKSNGYDPNTMGSTYFNKRIPMRTQGRRPRARSKSFVSHEKAEAWAKEQKIKKYTIKALSAHKYTVVSE